MDRRCISFLSGHQLCWQSQNIQRYPQFYMGNRATLFSFLLLERGIRLDVVDLAGLLNEPTVRQELVQVTLADQEVAVGELGELLSGEQTLQMQVDTVHSEQKD